MPRSETTFVLFQATVVVRAPISMPDATAESVSSELDELTGFLDDAARTFLNMRKAQWRKYRLKLEVR